MYLFLTVLGLHGYMQAFSGCGKWGLLVVEVHGLLTAGTPLVVEHRVSCPNAWDLLRPGMEPISPTLPGGPPWEPPL